MYRYIVAIRFLQQPPNFICRHFFLTFGLERSRPSLTPHHASHKRQALVSPPILVSALVTLCDRRFHLWRLETRFARLQSYFFDYRRKIFFDFAMATLAVVVFRLSSSRNRFFAAFEGDVIIGMLAWSFPTGPDRKRVL